MTVDMTQQAGAGQGIGLVHFITNLCQIGAAADELAGDVVSAWPSRGILERARVGGDCSKETISNALGNGPVGNLQQAIDEFTRGGFSGGDPVQIAIASVALVMVNIDQELTILDTAADLAEPFEARGVCGDYAIKLVSRLGFLKKMIGVEKLVLLRVAIFVPTEDLFSLVFEGES